MKLPFNPGFDVSRRILRRGAEVLQFIWASMGFYMSEPFWGRVDNKVRFRGPQEPKKPSKETPGDDYLPPIESSYLVSVGPVELRYIPSRKARKYVPHT